MEEAMGRVVGQLLFVLVLAAPSWVLASEPQGAGGVQAGDSRGNSAQAQARPSPRVRGSSPAMAEAIEHALEQSPTFQPLVTAIEHTDGIVYVHEGTCRRVSACLVLAVTQAGTYRILHIKVDGRKNRVGVLTAIGHELRHAIELLQEPTVVDGTRAHNFYQRMAPTHSYSFETEAAIQTGRHVNKEVRQWMRQRRGRYDGPGGGLMR
jgi:hypothetical protein